MHVGTRLNGWVPFFYAITLWGEKNFFQNFWIGVLEFLVFCGDFLLWMWKYTGLYIIYIEIMK